VPYSIRTFEVLLSLYFAFIPLLVSIQLVTAQTLVPGIHGMSIVPGVRFTWVIVSSVDKFTI
jgi:hypothetical protein